MNLACVLEELKKRESIFHHPAESSVALCEGLKLRLLCQDLENMVAHDFCAVSASGKLMTNYLNRIGFDDDGK